VKTDKKRGESNVETTAAENELRRERFQAVPRLTRLDPGSLMQYYHGTKKGFPGLSNVSGLRRTTQFWNPIGSEKPQAALASIILEKVRKKGRGLGHRGHPGGKEAGFDKDGGGYLARFPTQESLTSTPCGMP